MPYEVELKFVVKDVDGLRRLCESLGGVPVGTRTEIDTYLRHPARSFAETDEALRIRQTPSQLLVTYKGPKIDLATKTRTEIELEFHAAEPARVLEFWKYLGFLPVRQVRKEREYIEIPYQGETVHLSLDHVAGLGDFVELELSAESAQVEKFRQILIGLANRLGLQHSERKSYLELLLEKDETSADTPEIPEDWAE
jgi:adenylate cyclase class 2